jgi:hypothetical protein
MPRPPRRRGSRIAPWLLALAVSACSTATLPYKPESPPSGSGISADYVLLADRLRVELDTGGYRLEDAQIVRADGTAVRPLTIESPAPSGGGSSVGFGFGLGGGSYSRGSGVGVGTGIGVGVPLGADTRVQGNTLLYFALDQVGPAPWRLFVKAAETAPATIVLPPR